MRAAPGSLGPYELLDVLGKGGMATVFRGRHVELGAIRAVKVLLGKQTPARVERFLRETRHLAKVRHSNVVGVHDVGQGPEGQLYYAMDLVEGEPLDRVLQRGQMEYDRALSVAIGICQGVGALHSEGILHRDLKPANIVLRPSGEPVVLDLGLAVAPGQDARITKTGAVLGTPHYMAPEQVVGEVATARTDVYGLGLIAHELLSGYSIAESGALPGFAELPAPSSVDGDLPRAFDLICARALAAAPETRYANAGELLEALQALEAAPGISRRNLRRAQLGGVCAVALLGLGVLMGSPAGGGRNAEAEAPPAPVSQRQPSAQATHEATRELRRRVRAPLGERELALAEWIEAHPTHPKVETARIYQRDARLRSPLQVRPSPDSAASEAPLIGFLKDDTAVSYTRKQDVVRWTLDTNREVSRWDLGHLRALKAAPNGESFVVASRRRGIRHVLLDPPRVVQLSEVRHVDHVAFSPHGQRIAFVGDREWLHVLDLAGGSGGAKLGPFAASGRVNVEFSPDGRYVVSFGSLDVGIHVWDTQTESSVYHSPQLSRTNAVAFAPDGKTFFVARVATVGILNLEGQQLGLVGEASSIGSVNKGIQGLGLTPDGRYLHIFRTKKRDLKGPGQRLIWDAATRELLATIQHPSNGAANMMISGDGTRLLLATPRQTELWEVGVPAKTLPALDGDL